MVVVMELMTSILSSMWKTCLFWHLLEERMKLQLGTRHLKKKPKWIIIIKKKPDRHGQQPTNMDICASSAVYGTIIIKKQCRASEYYPA